MTRSTVDYYISKVKRSSAIMVNLSTHHLQLDVQIFASGIRYLTLSYQIRYLSPDVIVIHSTLLVPDGVWNNSPTIV